MITGSLRNSDGLDARGAWTSQNGIVTAIDLPALAADAKARAFVLGEGWREGLTAGRSKNTPECDVAVAECVTLDVAGRGVTIWFDRGTHLPLKAIAPVDDGVETTIFGDWRSVGGVLVAHRRTISDQTGASVTYAATNAAFTSSNMNEVSRPRSVRHGLLVGARAARVPFEFTGVDRGHIVVSAVANGKPVRLILDSGGANYLTPQSALALGLSVGGGVNIGGVGETSETGGFAHLDTIAIGGARLTDEVAIVGPLPYPALRPRTGMIVAGLTGYEFLSEFRTTIDYQTREVRFEDFGGGTAPGVALPFLSDGHSIYVKAAVEGVSGLFRLDTGDGGALTVFRAFAEREGLFRTGGRATIQAGGVGGAIGGRDTTARSFEIAATALRDVPVTISDTSAGAFSSRTLAGNIGSGVLSRFTVTFDYRARTVTLKPNDSIATPFARDRTGMSITQRNAAALDVLAVSPAMPAALGGLRAGDRIVAVGGRPVATETLGVFDLARLRFGDRPFALTVERGGSRVEVVIDPAPAKVGIGPRPAEAPGPTK